MSPFYKIIFDFKKFLQTPSEFKVITCFIESQSDIVYFEKIFQDIHKYLNIKILILTSDFTFKFSESNANYISQIIFIGKGLFRYLYFRLIDTKIFFMTTPDLGNSELKKSIAKVRYFYVFHSVVSTHMIYNDKAFDNYDYILTVGPHHKNEIETTEKLYGLNKKKLLPFGYPRIQDIKNQLKNNQKLVKSKHVNILIAPTWGSSSITDLCLEKIFETLINLSYNVIYRPHPISYRSKKQYFKKLEKKFKNVVTFQYDIKDISFLNNIDLIISDWSGFIIEFFLVTSKPVLFVDTPAKIKNLRFKDYKIEPLEKNIRNKIGTVVSLDNLNELEKIIPKILSRKVTTNVNTDSFYNYQKNIDVILNEIDKILNE